MQYVSLFMHTVYLMSAFCKCGITGHSRRHGAAQGSDSGHGNLLGAVFLGTGVSCGHHVGLQQSTLQVDVVVRQSLVHRSQDLGGSETKEKQTERA